MYWQRHPSQWACGHKGVCGGRGSVQETVIRSRLLARLHPWAVHCTGASGFPIVGGTGWPRALRKVFPFPGYQSVLMPLSFLPVRVDPSMGDSFPACRWTAESQSV